MTDAYQTLADIALIVHVAFVVFVISGLVAIVIGGIAKWPGIRNPWFRLLHLLAIGIVVAQAWAGLICPLTTLEMWLREQAGERVYEESFIQYWLQKLLYYDAPEWVFVAVYTAFGLAVLLTFILFPPRFRPE